MRYPIKKRALIELLEEKLKDGEDLYLDFNASADADMIMTINEPWPVYIRSEVNLEIKITQSKEFKED